mmetsp:Transcript_25824/g.38610  ORF Transcript_25824/g.38610 Transcript_25824/m.38610 type:complete len:82 (+) Transcript_25824:90-335(+)
MMMIHSYSCCAYGGSYVHSSGGLDDDDFVYGNGNNASKGGIFIIIIRLHGRVWYLNDTTSVRMTDSRSIFLGRLLFELICV